ncbi:MAG: DUF2634 domain-containing protein [Clostridia bacterium]|nr:DUF2634 domain-containing protein [Clostridia bacterium]
MTPNVSYDLLTLTAKTQPSYTYALDPENGRIRGTVDNIEAVKQAVYLILNSERYAHVIYSWNYGVELKDVIGQSKEYAISATKRYITEALMQDERITAVDNFEFTPKRDSLYTVFTVHTIFGDTEVDLNVRR